MFSNIGRKVRSLAWLFFVLCMVTVVVFAIGLFTSNDTIGGIIVVVLGFIASRIQCWTIYAIGVAADPAFPNNTGIFAHVGRKVKAGAVVLCVLGILLSVLLGVSIINGSAVTLRYLNNLSGVTAITSLTQAGINATALGVICIVVGSLISWVSSWVTYAIGQAADRR